MKPRLSSGLAALCDVAFWAGGGEGEGGEAAAEAATLCFFARRGGAAGWRLLRGRRRRPRVLPCRTECSLAENEAPGQAPSCSRVLLPYDCPPWPSQGRGGGLPSLSPGALLASRPLPPPPTKLALGLRQDLLLNKRVVERLPPLSLCPGGERADSSPSARGQSPPPQRVAVRG